MNRSQRILYSLTITLLAAILIFGAVHLIRGHHLHLSRNWQETTFYGLCLISSFLGGWFGFGLTTGIKIIKRQNSLIWLGTIFGFLYLASAVWCDRFHLGIFSQIGWRTLGLILTFIGVAIRLWAIAVLGRFHSGFVTIQQNHQLVNSGPYHFIRHPSYLGGLIAMVGTALVFGAWFPLLAVPGMFVIIKWRINDEEKLLVEHFGHNFELYVKQTHYKLFPYIY